MENKSGLRPIEYKVLVKPDPVENKTAGGIIIPDETNERQNWAQVKGTLIARGDSAFKDYSLEEQRAAKPGARVYYDKYEGARIKGADGEEYALLNDKNIGAVIMDEGAANDVVGRRKGGLSAA